MNLPTKLSLLVNRIASIRNLVILLVVTLLFSMVVFPWLDAITLGDNGEMLDMRFNYTPEAAYAEIEGYGAAGRSGIVWVSLIADGLFPFAYAFTLAIAITLTFRRAFSLESWMQRLHLFPFGALVFDFLENFTVSMLILLYPRQHYGLAHLAAAFTSTKWVLVYLSGLLAVVGLVGTLISRRKAAPQP